jgi:hypothetical protein
VDAAQYTIGNLLNEDLTIISYDIIEWDKATIPFPTNRIGKEFYAKFTERGEV